jgi:hypothetical protein
MKDKKRSRMMKAKWKEPEFRAIHIAALHRAYKHNKNYLASRHRCAKAGAKALHEDHREVYELGQIKHRLTWSKKSKREKQAIAKSKSEKMKQLWAGEYGQRMRKFHTSSENRQEVSERRKQEYASGRRLPPFKTKGFFKCGWINTMKGGNIHYDSGWELAFAEILDSAKIVKRFKKNPFVIPYLYKGEIRTFIPDYFVELLDGRKFVVELKGHYERRSRVRAKFMAAFRYCVEHDYEWVIIQEKPTQSLSEYIQ